jgi:hypothetical protein
MHQKINRLGGHLKFRILADLPSYDMSLYLSISLPNMKTIGPTLGHHGDQQAKLSFFHKK